MSRAAIISFRLNLNDGVSIVAATWQRALEQLGFEVSTIAGEGPVDRIVAGLAIDARQAASVSELEGALRGFDLVIVENVLTIPLNLEASLNLAEVLAGRRAILHHHDPAWQRAHLAHLDVLPPDDPHWRHVVINDLTKAEFEARGLQATRIYNGFEPDPPIGNRDATRESLGVSSAERLFVHPVRAIERKDIPTAVAICEELNATYWLIGPAEEGYGPTLAKILASAQCRVIHTSGYSPADFYAACDAVLFPSTWEGFGNPPIEAATYLKPALVGPYAVAEELEQLGFKWFHPDQADRLDAFLKSPKINLLHHNSETVRQFLSIETMTNAIHELLIEAGWTP
ncbi:MAG: glycosyltransferase [Acidimicrobiia bacterium]